MLDRVICVNSIPLDCGGMTERMKNTIFLLNEAGYRVITYSLCGEGIGNARFEASSHAVFNKEFDTTHGLPIYEFSAWINKTCPLALISFNSKLAQSSFHLVNPPWL